MEAQRQRQSPVRERRFVVPGDEAVGQLASQLLEHHYLASGCPPPNHGPWQQSPRACAHELNRNRELILEKVFYCPSLCSRLLLRRVALRSPLDSPHSSLQLLLQTSESLAFTLQRGL